MAVLSFTAARCHNKEREHASVLIQSGFSLYASQEEDTGALLGEKLNQICSSLVLVVEKDKENGLLLLELNPPNPWDSDPRSPEDLAFGEVQVTYLTHACMDLKLGDKRVVFDPWLIGPAFARGWWLLHEPPSDWLERLCQVDLIYISHMHSDHLSYPTLKKLAERRSNIPIYVGNTERPVFWNLNRSGVQLTNIHVVPFGIWQQVDRNLRFMILMDGVHPEMDTCIIVEYKGHKILNTVDCTRPNGGRLPMKVDLMMSDFAGGASGFPMTFSGGKFTEKGVCNLRYIKETNIKNDPDELNNLIKKNSDVVTWTPRPGATLDLGRMLKDPTDRNGYLLGNWKVGSTGEEVSSRDIEASNPYRQLWERLTCPNHEMIETDEDFNPFPGGYDYLVDFLDLSFPKERPSREHPYEEIRSRVDVIRHVVKNGLLWDDLYIGFQTRLQRDPDIYHHLWRKRTAPKPRENAQLGGFLTVARVLDVVRSVVSSEYLKQQRSLFPESSDSGVSTKREAQRSLGSSPAGLPWLLRRADVHRPCFPLERVAQGHPTASRTAGRPNIIEYEVQLDTGDTVTRALTAVPAVSPSCPDPIG
ncbi:cytidine monophosphate-N-acetylneuraminic acid hydroxylase [Camelus ferus]|nr:cytidine monophosphate-N-acetylneuraminic acid hydroxylase [Camelus ferus]